MFIPLRTDRPTRRTPIVTTMLIGVSVAVHLGIGVAASMGWMDLESAYAGGALNPRDLHWWQFLTSQFLHDPGGLWHLGLNMVFLWVFGTAVESRLGRAGFLIFYLLGGVAAMAGHLLVSGSPVIGASGAVAAVVGAFLALFPRSHIIGFFILTLSVVAVPSLWLIGLYFVIDLLSQANALFAGGYTRVAYMAHLAGYVFGFGAAVALLGLGMLKREEFDVFYLLKQARRRAAFRAANRDTLAGAWDSAPSDTARRLAQRAAETPDNPQTARVMEIRGEIHRLATAGEWTGAMQRYLDLLAEDSGAVMPEERQLDLANHLYAAGRHETAAQAYELFLRHYVRSSRTSEVRLLLAACYVRRLNRPQRARELIEQARPSLLEHGQQALADQLLAELAT